MTILKSYKVPWGMARVVGEIGHLPLSATLPSEYQPGQTSGAQLFHPTQMLSELFKGTCAILIHYPSSSLHPTTFHPPPPNAITRSVHSTPSLRIHNCSLGQCPSLPSSVLQFCHFSLSVSVTFAALLR